MTSLGIMQPYVFPYIGYFQLVNAVDDFIFYDDVNFIKQGWINRNRILVGGKEHMFTIPVGQISSFTPINETRLHIRNYQVWKDKFLRTIAQEYKKAPYFEQVNFQIKGILNTNYQTISELAEMSVKGIASYLEIGTTFSRSSEKFADTKGMEKADRLIEICKRTGFSEYINPVGGQELYNKLYFRERGVQLRFIQPSPDIFYKQFNNAEFVPGLSIIDVLMFNSAERVTEMLSKYTLV